ncbi:MAG: DUF2630 family protein [Nocardioidaceae bacterium]
MDESDIIGRIDELIAEEHELRSGGEASRDEKRHRLAQLEESLDQCWDLLRQRRARIDAGQDPDAAHARPVSEVESYKQ